MLDAMAARPEPTEATKRFLARTHAMWIDGDWREALSGKRFDVHNPATGETIGSVPEAGDEDVDLAVRAARAAFERRVWHGKSIDERAQILWRFGDLVEAYAGELAEIDIVNNGMNRALGDGMVAAAASWLRSFAGETQRIFGRNASGAMSSSDVQFHSYSLREPVGVAGLICAWNGPLGAFIVKVGTALAAGCTVVVKPAENTPLSALRLAELAHEAGVPPGVLNVVTGFGATGEAIVAHPGVDKISFTGSTAVGKRIVTVAAPSLKRVTLELGGKSPSAIFDDADIEQAIPAAAMGIYLNAGQICSAGSRLYVQRKAYDNVVAGIADFAGSIRLGNGLDPANDMGPLISAKQHERVMSYIHAGRAAGAEVVAGGEAPDGAGHFVRPTIFANVDADMCIVREEIFGPVLVVTPFDDAEDFIAHANDTRYGLASGIFSKNVDRVHQIAARLQAGTVWANCYSVNHPALPFGGYKESGWGHELGEEGLGAYLSTKSVFIKLGNSL